MRPVAYYHCHYVFSIQLIVGTVFAVLLFLLLVIILTTLGRKTGMYTRCNAPLCVGTRTKRVVKRNRTCHMAPVFHGLCGPCGEKTGVLGTTEILRGSLLAAETPRLKPVSSISDTLKGSKWPCGAYAYMYIHIHTYIHTRFVYLFYVYVYVCCVYLNVCIRIYIYIYRERERGREGEGERQTDPKVMIF